RLGPGPRSWRRAKMIDAGLILHGAPLSAVEITALLTSNMRLKRRLEERDRMLSAATHDMTGAIATISMYLSVEDQLNDDQRAAAHAAVERQARELQRLVKELRKTASDGVRDLEPFGEALDGVASASRSRGVGVLTVAVDSDEAVAGDGIAAA